MVNVGEDNFLKQMKKIKFLILISTLLIYNSCKSVSYQKNNELCSCFESFFHELNNFELNSLHYLSGLEHVWNENFVLLKNTKLRIECLIDNDLKPNDYWF
jgi:hypothetical protein